MTRIDERDLITLNAYLDNQLSPGERSAFEQRLNAEPSLQQELESLQATVALLKRAEPIRAPRNFTLDPKVYGVPPRRSLLDRLGLLGVQQLVTAGGAIAATLICAGLIFYAVQGGRFGPTASAPEAAMLDQERIAVPAEQPEEEAAAQLMQSAGAEEAAEAEETAEAAAQAPPYDEDMTTPPDGDPLYGLDGPEGGAGGGGGGAEGAGGGGGGREGPSITEHAAAEATITILQATQSPVDADVTAVAGLPTNGDTETVDTEMASDETEGASTAQPGTEFPIAALAVGTLVLVLAAASFAVYRWRRR